jgi:hypothetical protein
VENTEKDNTMKNYKNIILAATSALAMLVTVGCDHTLSKTESTRTSSDGSVKTRETTVTEHPDGTVSKTEETKKTTPANP